MEKLVKRILIVNPVLMTSEKIRSRPAKYQKVCKKNVYSYLKTNILCFQRRCKMQKLMESIITHSKKSLKFVTKVFYQPFPKWFWGRNVFLGDLREAVKNRILHDIVQNSFDTYSPI